MKDWVAINKKGLELATTADSEFLDVVGARLACDTLYTDFVCQRMEAFHCKQLEQEFTPTISAIRNASITNPYRILDRGSQFIFTHILTPETTFKEQIFLLYVYRWLNLPSSYASVIVDVVKPLCDDTLKNLRHALEEPDLLEQLIQELIQYVSYKVSAGFTMFSSAYLLHPPRRNYMNVLHTMFRDGVVDKLCEVYERNKTSPVPDVLARVFTTMRQYGGYADFLSYQIALDVNYLFTPCAPINFVVPGPGARKGLGYLFGPLSDVERVAVLHYITTNQATVLSSAWKPYVGADGTSYALQLNDIQNTFCEYSKVMNVEVFRNSIRRKYTSTKPPLEITIPTTYPHDVPAT